MYSTQRYLLADDAEVEEKEDHDDDDDGDAGSSVNELRTLYELREEQQLRHRRAGMNVQEIIHKSKSKSANIENTSTIDASPLVNQESTSTDLARLQGRAFTGQTDRHQRLPHEALMESYVEAKLANVLATTTERRRSSSPDIIETTVEQELESQLYRLPPSLQVSRHLDTGESSGPLQWNAGIAEVECGSKSGTKNVMTEELDQITQDQTEAAIARAQAKRSRDAQSSALPVQHFTADGRGQRMDKEKIRIREASDDVTVKRFIRRQHQLRHNH